MRTGLYSAGGRKKAQVHSMPQGKQTVDGQQAAEAEGEACTGDRGFATFARGESGDGSFLEGGRAVKKKVERRTSQAKPSHRDASGGGVFAYRPHCSAKHGVTAVAAWELRVFIRICT